MLWSFTFSGAELRESRNSQQNKSVWERQESKVSQNLTLKQSHISVFEFGCVWSHVSCPPKLSVALFCGSDGYFPYFRKNWTQTWTVLLGGVLTFHKDPKSAATGSSVRYTLRVDNRWTCMFVHKDSQERKVLILQPWQPCFWTNFAYI